METALNLAFADGRYRFWLSVSLAIEFERKVAPLTIAGVYSRLMECSGINEAGEYVYLGGDGVPVAALRELIRCALIGGNCGMVDSGEIEVGPLLAQQLVNEYVYPARPMAEALGLAMGILAAQIHGIQLKKKADEPPETTSPTTSE